MHRNPGPQRRASYAAIFARRKLGMRRASLPPSLSPSALLAAGRAQGQCLEAGHVLPLALSFLLAHCCCCKEMQAGERSCLRVMGRAVGRSIGAQGTCLEHGLI